MRTGVIQNARSRRNRDGLQGIPAGARAFAPETSEALMEALRTLATDGIDLLVIDGGDGTVRDVLSLAPDIFAPLPLIAVLAHGKTNALARDLGLPSRWTATDAIQAAKGSGRLQRRLVEVARHASDTPVLRGFIFGAGAYVAATRMAQGTHRAGLFDGLAIGATLVGSALATLFGGDRGLAAGETMRLDIDGQAGVDGPRFLAVATTLETLPLGVRPFGRVRAGLKLLDIDAPPRRLPSALPALLAGSEASWLASAGYRRQTVERVEIVGCGGFVLDGEEYPAGDLTLREGPLVTFVVP